MNEYDLLHPPIREPRATPARFLLLVAGGLAAFFTFFMLLLLLVSPGYDCPQCEDVAFNSALWKGASTDSFVRQQMVGDLLSRHRLLGLKQQAIEDLLGAPTPMGYSRAGCDYLTWLGPERSIFALDSNYLCLRFADGVVTNARIVED